MVLIIILFVYKSQPICVLCPVLNQVTIYLYILLSVTITLPYKEGGGDREVRMIL